MKKFRKITAVFVIVLCAVSLTNAFSSEASVFGDINGDGEISAVDARILLRVSATLEYISAPDEPMYNTLIFGDINLDGSVTALDARILLRVSANLESLTAPPEASQTKFLTTKPRATEAPTTEEITTTEELTTVEITTEEPTTEEPVSLAYEEPTSPEEMLSLYAEVMNKAKADQPGMKMYEYQEIPNNESDRKITKGKAFLPTLLDIVDKLNIVTSKEKAMEKPTVYKSGKSKAALPIYGNENGSLLDDATAVKSWKYELLKNGNAKIIFTLKDEQNPEPTPANSSTPLSLTGSVFNPISKKIADETLKESLVAYVMIGVNYDLLYHDCTAEIEFNPTNLNLISVKMKEVCEIDMSSKVAIIGDIDFSQQLYSYIDYDSFEY